MSSKKKTESRTVAKWGFATKEPIFDPALKMLDPPMDITHGMIRVLRRIDESVIVHGRPASLEERSDEVAPVVNASSNERNVDE